MSSRHRRPQGCMDRMLFCLAPISSLWSPASVPCLLGWDNGADRPAFACLQCFTQSQRMRGTILRLLFYVCLSVCVSLCLSVSLSQYVCLSPLSLSLSVSPLLLSVCLSLDLCLSLPLPLSLSLCLSRCLSLHYSLCLSLSVSLFLSVCLSLLLSEMRACFIVSVCLFGCLSLSAFLWLCCRGVFCFMFFGALLFIAASRFGLLGSMLHRLAVVMVLLLLTWLFLFIFQASISLWPSAGLICTKDFTSLLIQLNGPLSLPEELASCDSCRPISLGSPSCRQCYSLWHRADWLSAILYDVRMYACTCVHIM